MMAGEQTLEVLDVTEAWFAEIQKIFRENFGALEMLGGNLAIHVFGVGTRTVITSGPRKGLYADATDDPVHLVLAVQQWVVLHLLDPDPEHPLNLEAAVEDGNLVIDGDPDLYHRFMELGRTKKNLLSIRFN